MTVQVRIPTILRSYTGGAAEVTAAEGTLREVIAGLDAAYPGLGGRIIDDGGKLRRFVNVYVGDEDVRFAQGLDTHVPAIRARYRSWRAARPKTAISWIVVNFKTSWQCSSVVGLLKLYFLMTFQRELLTTSTRPLRSHAR